MVQAKIPKKAPPREVQVFKGLPCQFSRTRTKITKTARFLLPVSSSLSNTRSGRSRSGQGHPASCSMFNSKSPSPYLNPPFPISSHLSTLPHPPIVPVSFIPFIIVFLFAFINHHLAFLSLKRNDGVAQEGERDPGLLGQARRAGRAIRRSLTHTSL